MTSDSVIDNIRSLETCNLVIVDIDSPSWVLREIEEHHKLAISIGSAPEGSITAMVDSHEKFDDIVALLRPFSRKLTPVSEEYIRRLAIVMAMYPVRRCLDQRT